MTLAGTPTCACGALISRFNDISTWDGSVPRCHSCRLADFSPNPFEEIVPEEEWVETLPEEDRPTEALLPTSCGCLHPIPIDDEDDRRCLMCGHPVL